MGKTRLEYAFHPFQITTIQQRTGAFSAAVVIDGDTVYRVPSDKKKGSAVPLEGGHKDFWLEIMAQVSKAYDIGLIAFAPNKVQEKTVRNWLPEPDNRD